MRRSSEATLKKIRQNIITAVLLALVVIGPASVFMGITYQVSRNETISSMIFFGTFLADLIGLSWWASHQLAPAGRRTHMSVHQFVAHMKMHPELMPPGMTEFDLESFRRLQRRWKQMGFDAWLRLFRGETTLYPSSQFR